MRNDTRMLVLMPNESILLQRDASIVIKHKYVRAKESGKGTFYVTTYRLVFEDHKKGIILQVYPFNNELQAYRVNKSLLGGEKLMLDVQKQYEGKTILALVEVSMKNASEAINTINTMYLAGSSNMGNVTSSNVTSVGSNAGGMSNASDNTQNKRIYAEDIYLPKDRKKEPLEEIEYPLREGEEILAVINDVDFKKYTWDIENDKVVTKLLYDEKGMRLVMTNIQDIGATPEGWVGCSFNPKFYEPKVEGLTVKIVDKDSGEIEQEFTFKSKEDVDTYINTLKKSEEYWKEIEKKDINVTKLPRTKKMIIKTRGQEPPIIEPLVINKNKN